MSEETTLSLPDSFQRRLEKDLNKVVNGIPDYFAKNYSELKVYWNYPNVPEFLVGWCTGSCQASYIQGFYQLYAELPTEKQIADIRKLISRRKTQFEQGVVAFLEEKF